MYIYTYICKATAKDVQKLAWKGCAGTVVKRESPKFSFGFGAIS